MAISYGYDRTRPRTRIELDASSLSSSNTTSEKPLVIIGSAHGGEPRVPVEITNFSQAKEIFRGGELLDAIELAWRPSPNQSGAGKIFAIRTDDAKQSTLTKDGLKFTSKLHGNDSNNIQVSLTTAGVTGAKQLTVAFADDEYERVYSNLGDIFSIKYTGEEAGATIDVVLDEDGKARKLILKSGESGDLGDDEHDVDTYGMDAIGSPTNGTGEVEGREITTYGAEETVDREFPLGKGTYKDINVLVNAINNLPDYEANMSALGGNRTYGTEYLDEVKSQDIKTKKSKITALAGDLIHETANDRYVGVGVELLGTMPEDFDLISLAGGSSEPGHDSWGDIFEKIDELGAYYIVPLTEDEAVHGELSQFIREESSNGNHLRAFIGGGLEESIESLRSRQMNVRNARVSLVGNSGERRMSDGRVANFPGYMFASMIAGLASGLSIGEPVTYKHLALEKLDEKYTGDELDQLDGSGIVMIEFVRTRGSSFYRVVSDPTTYNSATEPVQNKISLGEVSDFLTTELRTILDEEFIGTRIHTTSASILKNRVESFLDGQKNVDGLIVDYSPDDVQVVITGNTARINLAVQPAQGLDFINVHIKYDDNELVG